MVADFKVLSIKKISQVHKGIGGFVTPPPITLFKNYRSSPRMRLASI
ncbi:hypothetical protein HMPREF1427_01298 [Helicobacter pylori GAM83Bi]|nr:hypothetical protein HMPREF1427_01298 [Helicobacter pylori GAM83Bi]EMH38531.1 hypothetical protein HMPREF1428_01122 [Helicobacter pylori GAM83T]